MRTVRVNLQEGWVTEEWKLRRLFRDLELFPPDPGSQTHILRLTFMCSDSRLLDERSGFPHSGLNLTISVPSKYMTLSTKEGLRVIACESRDIKMPGPADILNRVSACFSEGLSSHMTLAIFYSLKKLDRELPDLWLEAALEKPSETTINTSESESLESVGRFRIHSELACRLSYFKGIVSCTKCKHESDPVEFSSATSRFTNMSSCSICERSNSVYVSNNEVTGVDCAVAQVIEASFWIFCGCGKDCSYINGIRVGREKRNIAFKCGCPETVVKVDFECTVRLISRKKDQISPRLRAEESPTRKFKVGVALPMNGACKHYKKSFRWLKYPCCNEWYACNQCHDSRVTNHERGSEDEADVMLCGFCSVEQSLHAVCCSCGKETTPGWSVKEKVSTEPKRKPPYWKRRK
jgi:uncharacterized CHY-type Zn-finger protein